MFKEEAETKTEKNGVISASLHLSYKIKKLGSLKFAIG